MQTLSLRHFFCQKVNKGLSVKDEQKQNDAYILTAGAIYNLY